MICYCPVQSSPARPHSALMPMWCRAAGSTCTRMAATVRCSATRRRSTSVTLRRSDLSCPECHGVKSTGGSCLHRCAFRLTIPASRIPSSIFWCSVRQKQWSLCRRSSTCGSKNPKGLTATSQHRPAAVQSYWIMEQLLAQDAALGLPHDALYRCSLTLQLSAFCYATISGLPQETQQAVFRLCCALYAKALPQESALPPPCSLGRPCAAAAGLWAVVPLRQKISVVIM